MKKGYKVYGASPDADVNLFSNLSAPGSHDRATLTSVTSSDYQCP